MGGRKERMGMRRGKMSGSISMCRPCRGVIFHLWGERGWSGMSEGENKKWR